MRATRPAGKALTPETVMPHGSNPTTTAAAGTPGRATCTITAPSLSITSMGGSQHWASETWARTNCRCSRSACSSKDRASPHIQVDRSRGPMRGCPSHKNGTWGRPRGLQRDAPKERQDHSARGCRLPPASTGVLTLSSDQGERVTLPSLHDGDEWTRFEAARRAGGGASACALRRRLERRARPRLLSRSRSRSHAHARTHVHVEL